MKRQCDEKRYVYNYMVARYRERGRSKGGKGESFSLQQLQTAYVECAQEATLFVFLLKSLKQGQSRNLLTQAARHHAEHITFWCIYILYWDEELNSQKTTQEEDSKSLPLINCQFDELYHYICKLSFEQILKN